MEELIKIEVVNGKLCVTSLQMAEAFGKEHFHVMRDIRETIAKCSKDFAESNFGLNSYSALLGDGLTKECPMYLLTKDGFMMVAMGYVTHEAMTIKEAYINRFNQMERQLAEAEKGILPQTYPEALRALAAEVELKEAEKQQRLLAERQRDDAIRTKAQIGSRREATSMATASAAVRQRDALADRMGEGRNWKTVRAISWLLTIFAQSNPMYSQVGKKLTALSDRMGYAVHTVEDSRFGMVKSYHVDVIGAFKIELDKDPNMLGKYRRAA